MNINTLGLNRWLINGLLDARMKYSEHLNKLLILNGGYKMKKIYEFEIEDSDGNLKDSVEAEAESTFEALNKVAEWTQESNAMFDLQDRVRPIPVWISGFYVS